MSDEDPPAATSTVLPLLAAGVLVGGVLAYLVSARQEAAAGAAAEAPLEELELALRDELPWAYETSVEVHRMAGEIAVHVHDRGGLPGLVGPLDGPVMDVVDWQEPGGARLRFHVHALPGYGRSEVTVKVAKGDRRAPVSELGGLDRQVRSALVALRKELEHRR